MEHGLPDVCLALIKLGCLGTGRLYVDDIILLQVVARRSEDVLGTDIVPQDTAFVAVFTDDTDTVQSGLGGKVSCHGDGLQQGDAVSIHFIGAFSTDFTQNRER